jgi:electron transfer flavoprotein alpha subunit
MTLSPVFVVAEIDRRVPLQNSLELLAAAIDIAGAGEVIAICLGSGVSDSICRDLGKHGAKRVILVDDPIFGDQLADAWVRELYVLTEEYNPGTILFPHSVLGTEVAPRLAFRLGTAVVMGCIGVQRTDRILSWTRSCYGGNARETVSVKTKPAIVTIREKSFEPKESNPAAIFDLDQRPTVVMPSDLRTRVICRSIGEQSEEKLETADIVVSGGRGMGGANQFERLEQLAELLGGAPGASRVACDLGWCPPSWQVGLSGKTITPNLYFAFGISGAAQHLAGCGNSGAIVAVNTDPDAEIFKSARFGVVADCNEFIDAFISELRKIRSKK